MIELKEFRPGKWAKLSGGQVIGMASAQEVIDWQAAQQAPAAVALDDQGGSDRSDPKKGELWEPLPLFTPAGGDGGQVLGVGAFELIGQQVGAVLALGDQRASDGQAGGELAGPDLDAAALLGGELPTDQAGELGRWDLAGELGNSPNLDGGDLAGDQQDGDQLHPAASSTPAPDLAPTAGELAGPGGSDPASLWLWVDPSRESGYKKEAFDPAAFLARAAALFQSKPWTGGRRPGRLGVNPENLIGNGLEKAAAGLGLRVMADPTVAKGTYRLALERE